MSKTGKKIHRTYRLQVATVEEIYTIAMQHEIGVSELADWLLTHGLAEIKAGTLPIQRVPASWRLVANG